MAISTEASLIHSLHLTTQQLYLVLRLRMDGVIPLLPLYAFTAWIRENYLYLYLYI
jgi:hypothetical protein